MTFEERMEAAERRRQDGNALFREERFEEALGKYRCVGGACLRLLHPACSLACYPLPCLPAAVISLSSTSAEPHAPSPLPPPPPGCRCPT